MAETIDRTIPSPTNKTQSRSKNPFNFDYGNSNISRTDSVLDFVPGRTYRDQVDTLFRASAFGSYNYQLQNMMYGIDRFHRNSLPSNIEYSGLTFITRPKLNLTSSNIRQIRELIPMDNPKATSMAFALRCYLDTKFCRDNSSLVEQSGLVDTRSPFMHPLMNRLTGISGFPDPIIETQTTEGGFHSEDQTYAIGSNGLRKTYELTLSFKDIQGSPVASTIEYWLKVIEHLTNGRMVAYAEDIDARRLCYTCSIYRFVMDSSRKRIVRYAKATGCFPTSVPLGAMYNVNDYEYPIQAVSTFSIPFTVNHVAYNDYAILLDFNRIMRRYCPNLELCPEYGENSPFDNFTGYPYINTGNGGMMLEFRDPDYSSREVSMQWLLQRRHQDAWAFLNRMLQRGDITAMERENYWGTYLDKSPYARGGLDNIEPDARYADNPNPLTNMMV